MEAGPERGGDETAVVVGYWHSSPPSPALPRRNPAV